MGRTVEGSGQADTTEREAPYGARGEGAGGSAGWQDHLKPGYVGKAFPKSEKDAFPGRGYSKFHVQEAAFRQLSLKMVAAVAFVARSTDNNAFSLLCHGIHIGLK